MTIGMGGMQQSHLNLIATNLRQNFFTKVKTSSSKAIEPLELGNLLVSSDFLNNSELLMVKGRDIMIGRLSFTLMPTLLFLHNSND